MPYWIINTGQCYGTDEENWVELIPESAQKLYSRNTEGEPVLADKEYLRSTLLFYGFTIPESLQTVTERQTAIQEEYEKKLEQALKSITSAKALKKEDAVISELETRYANLLTEMTTKLNDEVTNNA